MKIDLFTFIAQIINFIILVVLLYFFLYKKIIEAIDHKEKMIREEFEKAKGERKVAEEERSKYETHLREFEGQKGELLTQAQEEARGEKEQLLNQARSEIDQKREKWERRIETEKKEFLERLQKKMGAEVYATAQFVLEDLANADLQNQIYQRFVEVLEALSEEQKTEFQKAYKGEKKEKFEVVSSFELSQEEKESLNATLSKILQQEIKVSFLVDPEATLGITIFIDSYRLSWTTKNYFDFLSEKFEEVLEQKNE